MIRSRRADRMERHHKRAGRSSGINLVSLMDIFTILVFFLLVNSSDGEVLPTQKSVTLPESVAEDAPRLALVVLINDRYIMINGKVITSVAAIMDTNIDAANRLSTVLRTEIEASNRQTANAQPARQEVTIMGDRDIPYRLLKRVMASCTEAGFSRISLAVLQRPLQES